MVTTPGFIAYPAEPIELGATIESALESKVYGLDRFRTWKAMDIAGRFIVDEVQQEIDTSNVLIADISVLNFNVTFEVGYAIGRKKRVVITRNATIVGDSTEIQDLGIFDTIGYRDYSTSSEFAEILRSTADLAPLDHNFILDRKAPAYVILPKIKNDWSLRLLSRLKKAKVSYRSFDPVEQPRLSALDAIAQVGRSFGVLVPLERSTVSDARIHNLRAAFIAGLATGMEKTLSILQQVGDPVPIDYRDFVKTCQHPSQIDEAVGEFASEIFERTQDVVAEPAQEQPANTLGRLDLGASSAENEIKDLQSYYLETDAYKRVRRGEARIVVGRKGAGKTAIFYRVRDEVSKTKSNVVLDLRPDGYQLVKFKEGILSLLVDGTVEHLITAFWEYLLLLELCNKVLTSDRVIHMRNHLLTEPYRRLQAGYQSDRYVAEGDFSERMATLLSDIAQDYQATLGGQTKLSTNQITGLIYRHNVENLREDLEAYLKHKDGVWILFDNIDKGWPTHGLRGEDIVVIRTLIEATRKVDRALQRHGVECHAVVFLRNDVYELLVDETPDRGKESRVMLDWTDKDSLREMLRRRIIHAVDGPDQSFESVWSSICASHVHAEESSQYLIERSLMRPRCLIDLVKYCSGYAVNRRHDRIEEQDIDKGVEAYSIDLVTEIGLEIRDVLPAATDLLYAFATCDQLLRDSEVNSLLSRHGISEPELSKVIDILMWYGFLGVMREHSSVVYIFDVNYNMKLLRSLIQPSSGSVVYYINDAFSRGLKIKAMQ